MERKIWRTAAMQSWLLAPSDAVRNADNFGMFVQHSADRMTPRSAERCGLAQH